MRQEGPLDRIPPQRQATGPGEIRHYDAARVLYIEGCVHQCDRLALHRQPDALGGANKQGGPRQRCLRELLTVPEDLEEDPALSRHRQWAGPSG